MAEQAAATAAAAVVEEQGAGGLRQAEQGEAPRIAVVVREVHGVQVQQGVPAVQQGVPAVQQGVPPAGVAAAGASAEQPPPVVPGIVVGRPVDIMNGPAPQSLASLYALGTVGGELTEEEIIVLNYGASLMIFASIDLLATILHVVLAVVRITETPGRLRNYSDLLWVAFIAGPICGFIGARKLKRNLVVVYFAFCVVKTAYQLAWAVIVLQLWYVITALVQVWVTKIVSTFWRALHRIPPERCQQLLAQKAQVTMMCW